MNTENIKTTENAVRELIRETAKSKEGLKKLFSILKECGEHACLCGCPDKDAHLLKQKDDEIKTTLGKEAPPIEAEDEVVLQYENKIREKVRGILKEEYKRILEQAENKYWFVAEVLIPFGKPNQTEIKNYYKTIKNELVYSDI